MRPSGPAGDPQGMMFVVLALLIPVGAPDDQGQPGQLAERRRLVAPGEGRIRGDEQHIGIAEELHLSTDTVRNHVRRMLRALHAHSRIEALAVAHREGILRRD